MTAWKERILIDVVIGGFGVDIKSERLSDESDVMRQVS